jgi:hypothetical protein
MTVPTCGGCGRRRGAMHAFRSCRVFELSAIRPQTRDVNDADTRTAPCGCPLLLVQQFGPDGHRADCGRPVPRPPTVLTTEIVAVELTLGWLAALALTDTAIAAVAGRYGDALGHLLTAAAAIVAGVVLIVDLRRRRGDWPGRRSFNGDDPGRLIRCPQCSGDGLLHDPAYPPVHNHAPISHP